MRTDDALEIRMSVSTRFNNQLTDGGSSVTSESLTGGVWTPVGATHGYLLLFTTTSANHSEVVRTAKLVRLISSRSTDNLNTPIVKTERQVPRIWAYIDRPDHLSFNLVTNLPLCIVWRWKSKLMVVVR